MPACVQCSPSQLELITRMVPFKTIVLKLQLCHQGCDYRQNNTKFQQEHLQRWGRSPQGPIRVKHMEWNQPKMGLTAAGVTFLPVQKAPPR